MTYEEWQSTKKWLKERLKNNDLTQEEVNTYYKIIKMMYGQCLECRSNDGNFSKGACYNCSVCDSF